MIKIENLKADVEKSVSEKATVEIDRMIKIHQDAADLAKADIKRMLLAASQPGATPTYSAGVTNNACQWDYNQGAADRLRELKKELEKQ